MRCRGVVVCFLQPIVWRENRATILSCLSPKGSRNVVEVVSKGGGGVVVLECWGSLPLGHVRELAVRCRLLIGSESDGCMGAAT